MENTKGIKYVKCPNVKRKRYSTAAQMPTVVGYSWCTFCGHDHEKGKTPRDIILMIRDRWEILNVYGKVEL